MKSWIVIICLLLLSVTYAFSDVARTASGEAFIYKAQSADIAPVVDGVLDDPAWKDIELSKMEWESSGNYPWQDFADFEGQFVAVWKDSKLFMAVKIKDDNLEIDNPNPELRDNLEIYIDVNHYGKKNDSFKHTITVTENKTRQNPDNPFVTWDNKGRVCELKFELESIPRKGKIIGFGIFYNDVDNGHLANQIGWYPGQSRPNRKDQLVDLIFDSSVKRDRRIGTTWGNIKTLF